MCSLTPPAQLTLPSSVEAPALARQFLRSLRCPQHQGIMDDAVLMVSETVTNSVLYGGPPLVLAVDCDEDELRVRVRDGSTKALPAPRVASLNAESGRGLALVDAMSDAWGVEPTDGGKYVWFVLR